MAGKRKKKKKSSEELNTENELLKLKMMAEFGGDFVKVDEIPPDIENQFLKQIISFHKQHDNSKMTSIYKYIGEPEYNHVHDLNDKGIAAELKLLIKIMEKNGVSLTVQAETKKQEIYRFITEELFKMEIEDTKIKGWVHQFVYEDFYPNPDYEVRYVSSNCIESVFNKGMNISMEFYCEEMKDAIGLSIEPEELLEHLKQFQNEQHQLTLVKYDLAEVEINTETGVAHVVADIIYKTQSAKGQRFKTTTTIIELNLERSKFSDNWWEVKQIITDLF